MVKHKSKGLHQKPRCTSRQIQKTQNEKICECLPPQTAFCYVTFFLALLKGAVPSTTLQSVSRHFCTSSSREGQGNAEQANALLHTVFVKSPVR